MDTRFWGPSGWCLLHLIAANPNHSNKKAIKEWMELLEFILPCKYCRASFHEYMHQQPLTLATVANREAFSKWLYDIHNRVNDKLRGQGLLTAENPDWPSVRDKYYKMQANLCNTSPVIGWDFMTSIAYATPTPHHERLAALKRWWRLIPSILPCSAWRSAWVAALKKAGQIPLTAGRAAVMRWMWRVEKSVCTGLKCPTPHPSLPALQQEVAIFESRCASSKKGKTCRTRKHRLRRLALQTRRKRVQG